MADGPHTPEGYWNGGERGFSAHSVDATLVLEMVRGIAVSACGVVTAAVSQGRLLAVHLQLDGNHGLKFTNQMFFERLGYGLMIHE